MPQRSYGVQEESGVCLLVRRPLPQDCGQRTEFSFCLGNGLNVAKVMPESAIKFGAYEVSVR